MRWWRVGMSAWFVASSAVVIEPTAIPASTAAAGSGGIVTTTGAGFESLVPARLLDTREGLGAPIGKVADGSTLVLQVTGRGGVPDVGVGAVVLNVTATEATAATYITVFPAGETRPTASNLNLVAGDTVPNLVISKLGIGGTVSLYNNSGATHLIADVAGWFPEGPGVNPLVPARLLDTREGLGAPMGTVDGGSVTELQVAGRGGVPDAGVGAVVLNVTVTEPTSAGFITAYPSDAPRPTASNLNMVPGETRPNLVVVKVGEDGKVDLYTSAGSTHLVADVAGWFPKGSALHPLVPARLLDTRDGTGAPIGAVGPGSDLVLQVTGRGGVPAFGVGAVVLNVTVTEPTAAGFITAYPTGAQRPTASNLNMVPGQTVPNLVLAKLGANGTITLFNSAGSSHLVADVAGWFPAPGTNSASYDLKVGTVLAGTGDVVAATGDATTGGTVTLAGSADVPDVGGHLAVFSTSITPDGFAGLVTAVTPNADGTVTVSLAPASLDEIFNDINVISDTQIEDAPTFGELPRAGTRRTDGISCNLGGNLNIGPSFSLEGTSVSFEMHLLARYLRVQVRGALKTKWTIDVTSSISCSIESAKIPVTIWGAGGVFLQFSLQFSTSGQVSGGYQASFPISAGFKYDKGDVTNLNSADAIGNATFATQTSNTVQVEVSGKLSALVLGRVGLFAKLGVNVKVTIKENCITATAGINLSVGASAEGVGVKWSITFATIGASVTIYRSDGCDPIPTYVGTITVHHVFGFDSLEFAARTMDATITLHPTDWTDLEAPFDGFNGSQQAAVQGSISEYNKDPGGGCGSTHGSGQFNYDTTPYQTVSSTGQVFDSFGGWFLFIIADAHVDVAGLQDVTNYTNVHVTGINTDCTPVDTLQLEHPLYPPLDNECNDALQQGAQSEVDARLAIDPTSNLGHLQGSNSLTVNGVRTCNVTWDLTRLP